VKEVAVFAALEAFSQRNINCSISDSLKRFEPIMELRAAAVCACAATCPACWAALTRARSAPSRWPRWPALHDMGCYEVSLGDTIGTGTAGDTRRLFEVVSAQVPREQLAGHFHTYGQALANVYASLLEGISVFDSSVAGLGGCPYAKGATGNRHRRRGVPAAGPGH
jgi:hydroxymethylglutaryl-CoA lyase